MFHKGQKVVCINNKPYAGCIWYGREQPKLKTVYTVDRVGLDVDGILVVSLVEKPRHRSSIAEGLWGYRIDRFRPVIDKKTDISIFTQILDNVKNGKIKEYQE